MSVSGVPEEFRLRISGLLQSNGVPLNQVGFLSHEVARVFAEFTKSLESAAEARGYEDGYKAGLDVREAAGG